MPSTRSSTSEYSTTRSNTQALPTYSRTVTYTSTRRVEKGGTSKVTTFTTNRTTTVIVREGWSPSGRQTSGTSTPQPSDDSGVEAAKKRRSELEETERLRIKRRKEVDRDPDNYPPDEDLEEGWEMDMEWYSTYYKSLKISIQREVNNDVDQYFEKLYREFVQWKKARRPSVSPTVHPRAVFSSLTATTEAISFKILSTVGYTALHRRYADLSSVASELYACVRSLDDALDEEDAIDEDTVGHLRTVEERYLVRGYRFFGPALARVYEQAGL
ncbi:hypothetical protein PQX77_022138 [Marasmius sp. AFHP31]|nr:hypothetical protein PQX77_022138 [Marasmius sp. AFHP31]